jgi:hypothetical protein
VSSSSRRDDDDDDDDDDELVAMSPPPPSSSSSSSSSVPSGPRSSSSSSSSPAAATAALLASFLLLSSPLVLPPPADAAVSSPSSPPFSSTTTTATTKVLSTDTATSIDINLRSLSSLTRKAVVNREKLTSYLVESLQSIKPILDLLSEGDAPVLVSPPKDVRGAIDRALTRGDATFVINGEQVVDVRLESVPGVIIVRVINPNIPRLPFLGDGTAALEFVDGVVGAAPAGLEKAAVGARAVGDFLTWGAPRGAPVRYGGSSLDVFLSSKFGGGTTDLTNAEVVFLSLAVGIGGAYASSYAYYVSLREEVEREAGEKKAKAAEAAATAKKKKEEAAAAAAAKKVETKGPVAAAATTTAATTTTTAATTTTTAAATTMTTAAAASAEAAEMSAESAEAGNAKAGGEAGAVSDAGGGGVGESADVADDLKVGEDEAPPPRLRKRDAIIKNLFGRGKK